MWVRRVGVDRSGVDDRPAFAHVGCRRFRNIEHCRDVRRECLLPILVRDVFDRFKAHLMSGVVYDDIEATEVFGGRSDDLTAMAWR
jgi:hypothetical protein